MMPSLRVIFHLFLTLWTFSYRAMMTSPSSRSLPSPNSSLSSSSLSRSESDSSRSELISFESASGLGLCFAVEVDAADVEAVEGAVAPFFASEPSDALSYVIGCAGMCQLESLWSRHTGTLPYLAIR